MWRTLKVLFWVVVLVGLVLVGYAYLGDLTPQRNDVSIPLELDAN